MHVSVENEWKLAVSIPENTEWFGGIFPYFVLNLETITVTVRYKLQTLKASLFHVTTHVFILLSLTELM
jgi:hypothetical protein